MDFRDRTFTGKKMHASRHPKKQRRALSNCRRCSSLLGIILLSWELLILFSGTNCGDTTGDSQS